jgi:hypothetical protein
VSLAEKLQLAIEVEKPHGVVWPVRRLQPPEGKGFAEFSGRLFKYQPDELPNGEFNLGMERQSRDSTDSQNLNGVVIGNAVPFDLEKETLDDPGRHAVEALPIECNSTLVAQIDAARTETRHQENVGQQ